MEFTYFDNCFYFQGCIQKKNACKLIIEAVPQAINDPSRMNWMTEEYWKRLVSCVMPKKLGEWSIADNDKVRSTIIYVKKLTSIPRLLHWDETTDIDEVVVGFYEPIFFCDAAVPRDNKEKRSYYLKTSIQIDLLMESSVSKRLLKRLLKEIRRYLHLNAVHFNVLFDFINAFNENTFAHYFTGDDDVADNFAESCLKLLGEIE